MLHIHFSNRFEQLRAQLMHRLADTPAGPFQADAVVVPSAAVQRALTLAAADHLGISCQLRFSYLAPWLWEQMARVLPGVAAQSPFAAAVLRWRVMTALADRAFLLAHPRLQAYLEQADEVMRFELATRIAALFDQYLTYRPDWLLAWQQGRPTPPGAPGAPPARPQADEVWQAALWQRLTAGAQVPADAAPEAATPGPAVQAHRATGQAFVEALARLSAPQAAAAGLPPVVHLFALPTLPALHMHWLQHIARVVQVHVYVLNPCQEYWFELIDSRRLGHLAARGQQPEAAHHEVGHRLLASWGGQTQATIDGLIDSLDSTDSARTGPCTDDAQFVPATGRSLLARLQNSVLELQEPEPGAWPLTPQDRSVEIHVCHSLTRELEVLHDHLLGLLARGGAHAPEQVLVVTPDLEAAAPLIDAVFGTQPPARALPYTLTGRARSRVNTAARALLAVLALAPSRFLVSEVFALLQQDIVARRFGLDAAALQQLHDSLLSAGARWGLDAAHRAALGLPATPAQTWDDALDRLFLGVALPPQVPQPFGDCLPAADTEGSDALALGALAQFIARLRALHVAVARPRPPRAWQALLHTTVAQFMQPQGDELDDLHELNAALTELFDTLQRAGAVEAGAAEAGVDVDADVDAETAVKAGAPQGSVAFDNVPLSFAVLRAALAQQLDDPARGGVPTGGVTFSSMSSLRSLPYDHVCIVGLNDGAFPSAQHPPEFDLMPLRPRRGDRQRRQDERNLFLDLLLSARRSVYLSHTGRSVRDNAPLPPSVLVSELLDWLLPAVAEQPAGPEQRTQARQRLVVEHPLQPFDARAFEPESDPRLRSYNAELAAALRSSLRAQAAGPAARCGDPAVGVAPVQTTDSAIVPTGLGGEADDAVAVDSTAADGDGLDDEGPDDDASGDEGPGAAGAAAGLAPLPLFFSHPLPWPEPAWRHVSLSQLDEFFRNPCRSLLRRRLGLDLGRHAEALEDEESFVPDTRSRHALAARLLPPLLAAADASSLQALARAGPDWPPGQLGDAHLADELHALQGFAAEVRTHTTTPLLPPHNLQLQFTLEGETWQLTGQLNELRPSGLLRWRYGSLRASDRLSAWLAHLLLCAGPVPGVALRTQCLTLDAPLQLTPLPAEQARALLGELVGLYRVGLRQPLHFFPRSAWAYVERGGDLAAAQRAWQVSAHAPFAEGADAAYRLALRGCADPLDAAFEALAQQVFGPLREALAEAQPTSTQSACLQPARLQPPAAAVSAARPSAPPP